ncbi:hypothetical protein [Lamprobacter modestohalophilus]|nr:hypothetical protein [Lamprobacter modestohalophilus]
MASASPLKRVSALRFAYSIANVQAIAEGGFGFYIERIQEALLLG